MRDQEIANILKEALEIMVSDTLDGIEINRDVINKVRTAWCELKKGCVKWQKKQTTLFLNFT